VNGTRRLVGVLCVVVVIALAVPAGASGPGSLPQTPTEPTFGAPFHAQMKQLFRAIKNDSAPIGATVFFPEAAYVSMKTGEIPDPTGDYVERLIGFYDRDLTAYHARLFGGPRRPWCASMRTPTSPSGSRRASARTRSATGTCQVFASCFDVAPISCRRSLSLISWRGLWYVVHLGPNPRPVDVGTVDDFENGAGTPGQRAVAEPYFGGASEPLGSMMTAFVAKSRAES